MGEIDGLGVGLGLSLGLGTKGSRVRWGKGEPKLRIQS